MLTTLGAGQPAGADKYRTAIQSIQVTTDNACIEGITGTQCIYHPGRHYR